MNEDTKYLYEHNPVFKEWFDRGYQECLKDNEEVNKEAYEEGYKRGLKNCGVSEYDRP